ncbi:hypothetical protein [Siphonobacter sp.]|uniref:hypothetical protein n=1 Tax=Siphonobacter sp. TaxID=1869184 RepID=UPI003B3B8900
MKKRKRSWWLYQMFCLVMALHVINLSIDTPDHIVIHSESGETHEDPTINDMESLIEFVLEKGLGLEDVIPEHDDPDEDSDLAKFQQDYCFVAVFRLLPPVPTVVTLPQVRTPEPSIELLHCLMEISLPPPQATA